MNAIFTRRSVRHFSDKPIENEKIETLLRAAMQAPSAANQQPWSFIVVRGRENLDELSKYNAYAGCLKNADAAIIVLGDSKRMILPDMWQQDLAAATQNIQLQAVELGLGTVWLGTAPHKTRMEFICNLFEIDEHLLPYSVIAVGYPKKEDANHFIDRFDPERVRYIN